MLWYEREREKSSKEHPPTQPTFLSPGTGKVSGQKGALLQEFRDITGNKSCTEEPAVDKGAETDGMGEAQ